MEVPCRTAASSGFASRIRPCWLRTWQRHFRSWRTFHGYGIDDPGSTARFDWTKSGFHGYVLTEKGTVFIDPLQENDTENYLVYYKHEYGEATAFRCGSDDLDLE
ncbi:MAG: hypothetical protein IPG58_20890 [Acidobacteria bacterium]|nr:hypothetical protein [Acidobacteriota bacterium]